MKFYGPIRGPGVQVRELPAIEGAAESPLGTTVFVAPFRSGPVLEAVNATGPEDFARIFGPITSRAYGSTAAALAYGAGGNAVNGWGIRCVSDDAAAAQLLVYDRRRPRSILPRSGDSTALMPRLLSTLPAHNVGEWAGRFRRLYGKVASMSAAVTGATFQTEYSVGWVTDQWRGAQLRLADVSDSTFTVITSNDSGGLTLDQDLPAEAEAGTVGRYSLELDDAVDQPDGSPEHVTVEWFDGPDDLTFGATVTRQPIGDSFTLPALSLEETSSIFIEPILGGAYRQFYLSPGAWTENSVPSDPLSRPAAFAELVKPGTYAANRVDFVTARWYRVTGATGVHFDCLRDVTYGADPRPVQVRCVFLTGTTFSVAAYTLDGVELLAASTALPNGTVGTEWDSGVAWLPKFVIRSSGSNPSAGHEVRVEFRPLPADLVDRGAYWFPAAAASEGSTARRYRVIRNGAEYIEVGGISNVGALVTPPTAPTLTAATAGPFSLAGTDTLIFTTPGQSAITLTSSLGAGSKTTTQLVAELNALELARAGAANRKLVSFTVSVADKVTMTSLRDFGAGASLTIGAGTLNSLIGFTEGDTDAGVNGKLGRVQYSEFFERGLEGPTPGASAVSSALADGGPTRGIEAANTGGVVYLAPVYSSDATVLEAVSRAAERVGGVALIDLPPVGSLGDEAGAIAWFEANATGGSWEDHRTAFYPSWAYYTTPGSVPSLPVSAEIAGLLAKTARDRNGPHVAVAGVEKGIMSSPVRLETGDLVLDSEALTSYGLNEVRKRGARFFVYGDRIRTFTTREDGTPRDFIHARRTVGHVVRSLQFALEPIVFEPINGFTFARARRLTRQLMLPWYRAGWFDDRNGPAFEDQVSIVCDRTNNGAADSAAGNLALSVSFRPVGVAERVVVTLDPNGATVTT